MTRLDFNLNQKSSEAKEALNETEHGTIGQNEPATLTTDVQSHDGCMETEENDGNRPAIILGEVNVIIGDKCDASENGVVKAPPKTIDWVFIRRVSLAQIALAFISMTCLMVSIVMGGLTWYKFTTFFWSIFLLMTAHTGFRSATKNYAYVVAYLIMTSFQSLTNWFSLVYLTYIIYYVDNHEINYYKGIHYKDLALFLELTESLTLMGTVVTGLLGAAACCKGIGRVVMFQDQLIHQRAADAASF